ncbi:MAG: ornithine--oxo-acid transaminase [Cyanobacteria bacterium P01_H01_bin.74]
MSPLSPLSEAEDYIALEEKHGANNYHPLDIVIAEAKGCWVTDVSGKRYLDCLSAYSALNQGHCHPKILNTLLQQAKAVTLTSRAFRNTHLPRLYEKLHQLSGLDQALPMNSGAEACETAIKMARKWGYTVKGIPENTAEIIVFNNNFHGRTISIISFTTETQYKQNFGPFTPGFTVVAYNNIEAVKAAINANTCAVFIEPIQAEAGILLPDDGYLRELSDLCKRNNILLMVDEIQTGLGRTGKLFAFQHDDITPDVIVVGKALSGGFYPVSAVMANRSIMSVFHPGDHGSTYGGNPLGCAVACAAIDVLLEEDLAERSKNLGQYFLERLKTIKSPLIQDIRGRGLLIGIELTQHARAFCESLKARGILCKETHDTVIRFAPPLIITQSDLDWAFEQIQAVLTHNDAMNE